MATVTPTLTISSTDALVDTLSLSVTDSLAISGQSQYGTVVTGTSTKVDLTGSAGSTSGTTFGSSLVYFKNLSTQTSSRGDASTESIKIYLDEEYSLLLGPGEFALLPWIGDGQNNIAHQSVAGTPKLEFAIFEF